ncbi:putative Ubiquinone biosynthesis O-methyltransferase [Hypsibius exemplaris]|uniref:Ubiquinone biosynthesis O-methyltransferase n=1 Tax=Hypsibius exemplaris TaxID=2072580 RepID=A0A1W0X6D3_HYPEX|nr:putative Ubiquinone biosynthesis O-methyltransferase [Hypsibius exemplaris]
MITVKEVLEKRRSLEPSTSQKITRDPNVNDIWTGLASGIQHLPNSHDCQDISRLQSRGRCHGGWRASALIGARIINVGFGAGFVAEPLAEYGADVTAVDMVPEIIEVARTHWTDLHGDAKGPEYLCASVETLAPQQRGQFDTLPYSEVLDHAADMPEFLRHCCKFVRPGDCALFTTFNQTVTAGLLGIIVAEHILRIVSMHTHHLHRFIKTAVMTNILVEEGFRTLKVSGCLPVNPLASRPVYMDIPYTGVT